MQVDEYTQGHWTHSCYNCRHSSASEDLVIWTRDPNGSFSYKGAYCVIKDQNHKVVEDKFQWIWKWLVLNGWGISYGMFARGCFLTNIHQVPRHMTSSDLCSVCGNASELDHHILICVIVNLRQRFGIMYFILIWQMIFLLQIWINDSLITWRVFL